MEVENKVSVFIGEFSSEEELSKFTTENFTEDGDIFSDLMSDLGVDFIDSQFQEVLFVGEPINITDFNDFSYSESFTESIGLPGDRGNSLILLYNFDYSKSNISPKKLKFIGVYDYH